MNTSDPVEQVLVTPELLELILAQLDIRTLLTSAQRVSRSWHALIQDSHPLQEALYFRPIKPECSTADQRTTNPLLAQAFSPIFTTPPFGVALTLNTLDLMTHPAKQRAYLRPDASWRRMLVTQPPATSFGHLTSTHGQCGDDYRLEVWKPNPDQEKHKREREGLRMAPLFELALSNALLPSISDSAIIWWGHGSGSKETKIWECVKKLGSPQLPDVLICGFTVLSCVVSCEEEDNPILAVQREVQLGYKEAGLRWELLGEEWAREVLEANVMRY
ncbi:F-box protein [Aspergillus homomorphus CBS 101889]|uniref:F-box domain-containing protein n=1 Tax=Aspergillus homomorphus (strain CBS 101889) TaxID=1450537 RepID=A0A395HLQ5_ASPHC|nr:hypothetical protein BO97DRAFT_417689 [Aspergillus homomorphus CBS 101889]RAL08536.1 hypothetical protein BO97DRAFT_417689 [Aspergillus homomorphus CBS 101889]